MQKYTKAIIAFAGVLLPFLESLGVVLPEFLSRGDDGQVETEPT